jgi:hypothetical protein
VGADVADLSSLLQTLGMMPQNAYQTLVPLVARAYIKSLVGSKTPMTESDLSNADMQALQRAVEQSIYRSQRAQYRFAEADKLARDNFGKSAIEQWPASTKEDIEASTPSLQYEDYPENSELGNILQALAIPDTGMMHTIGRAQIETDPNKNVHVKDTYGFNPVSSSLWEGLKHAGPYGLLRVLGSQQVGDEGYPVDINIGKRENWPRTEMPINYDVKNGYIPNGDNNAQK